MTQISVRLEGETVRRSISNIGTALPKITRRSIERAMKRAKTRAAHYPPELAGQRYIRTGTYGRSFAVVEEGLTYRLQSDAVSPRGQHYTRYVGGYADLSGQAEIHAGRWVLIGEAVDDEIAPLLEEIDGDISDLARQEGVGP